MATKAVPFADIKQSISDFDLNSPLTKKEITEAGLLLALPVQLDEEARRPESEVPLLKDIEEIEPESFDAVQAFTDNNGYNQQYVHYLRCQSLVALTSFEEGWKSFEEMVLKEFVRRCKRDNGDYRGDDPNRAFSLRVRQQTAEDFLKFIRGMVSEAAATPKPSLAKKQ